LVWMLISMVYTYTLFFVKVKYKYRFYPTDLQKQHLASVFGCSRFVYNWALRQRTDAYANGERMNYNQSSVALTKLKKDADYAWLNDVSCVPLQQSLRHLQTAFKNFFDKRTGYPSFKSKYGKQSAEFTSSAFKWDADNRNLRISKLGRLRIKWSRHFKSTPTTATITKDCAGRYFVTLTLDEGFSPFCKTHDSVGIDVGLNRLATLSNGEYISNPRHTRRMEKKLAREQRKLAKKVKGSNRYNLQKLRVAKVHAKITDSRKDNLDKFTTNLVRRFDLIAIEDLSVRNMVKNHCLAKAISDASFSTIRAMLEYKVVRYGKDVVAIDRFFPSSKRCHCCGFVSQSMPLSVRTWTCPECSAEHDRDLNAALNILAVGQTVSGRGETVRPAKLRASKASLCEASTVPC